MNWHTWPEIYLDHIHNMQFLNDKSQHDWRLDNYWFDFSPDFTVKYFVFKIRPMLDFHRTGFLIQLKHKLQLPTLTISLHLLSCSWAYPIWDHRCDLPEAEFDHTAITWINCIKYPPMPCHSREELEKKSLDTFRAVQLSSNGMLVSLLCRT